jgi:ribosomal protein S18 acetylase RimI-like enzyme
MALSYRTNYPEAAFAIVTLNEAPIGQLILDAGRDRLHVVCIALLPDWQRQGLGSVGAAAGADCSRSSRQT